MNFIQFICNGNFAIRVCLASFAAVLTLVGTRTPAEAVGSEAAVAEMRPAVVFILLPLAQETGSGVVVRTDTTGSYIVTAAHVVKAGGDIDVYFQGDKTRGVKAQVVRIDPVYDLAVIHTSQSAAQQVSLASDVLSGDRIEMLGYPTETTYAHLKGPEALEPEARLGSVTSVRSHASLISTSAPTEPGDSGSPIFEQDGAKIVGIVTGHFGHSSDIGFQGAAVGALRRFLTAANISFYGSEGLEAPKTRDTNLAGVPGINLLQEARGAHKLLADVEYDVKWGVAGAATTPAYVNANATSANASQSANTSTNAQPGAVVKNATSPATQDDSLIFATTLSKAIASSLGPQFDSSIAEALQPQQPDTRAQQQRGLSPAEIGKMAADGGYVGGIQEILSLHAAKKAMGLLNQFDVSTQINVIDQYGDVIFSATASKSEQQPIALLQEQVDQLWDKVTQDAIAQVGAQVAATGADGGKNFGRFGIPLATGAKSPFFAIAPDRKGARVTAIYPYGTAARSTLQLKDVIVALDGQDLSKMSPEQLTDLFNHHAGSVYRCTVLEPDGQAVVVGFEAQDVRWYMKNPVPPSATVTTAARH